MTTLREYLSNGASHTRCAPREDEYDDQQDRRFDFDRRIGDGMAALRAAENNEE